MKYHLNLSNNPFPHYRTANVLLSGVVVLTLVFSVWQLVSLRGYVDDVRKLAATKQELRVEWESLGDQIEDIDARLRRPEALAEIDEVLFLNTVIARQRFSWTLLLNDIERVIPQAVYLVALEPETGDSGEVLVRLEARGQTIDGLSEFIRDLEGADTFRDVAVSSESRGGVDGLSEIQLTMTVQYMPRVSVAE
jgi:Tfp pilus assembly protein PilN